MYEFFFFFVYTCSIAVKISQDFQIFCSFKVVAMDVTVHQRLLASVFRFVRSMKSAFECSYVIRIFPLGVPSDQSSGTSSPLCDSGLHLNYHPNNTVHNIALPSGSQEGQRKSICPFIGEQNWSYCLGGSEGTILFDVSITETATSRGLPYDHVCGREQIVLASEFV